MATFLTVRPPTGGGGTPPRVASDEEFRRDYPCLFEYLTVATWADSSPRETSTLTLFVEDGAWKVALNDRAVGRTAFLSGGTVASLLAHLEEALRMDEVEWRSRQPSGPRRSR